MCETIRWLEVQTYTTVSTVCAPPLLGGLVNLDVLDDEVGGVKALGIGVGLGVPEELEQKLSRLHGPASPGNTELLSCCSLISASISPCLACVCGVHPTCTQIP